MNLKNKCVGLLPLLLSAAACSDMSPDSDTYNTTILGLSGGAGGDDTGIAGSSGSGGAGGNGDTTAEQPLDEDAWGCLSTGITMPPPTPARIKYQVLIVDFDSQPRAPTVVPELSVEVCLTSTCDRVLPPCDPTAGDPTPTQQCSIVTQGSVPVSYIIEVPYGLENGGLRLKAPGYAQMNYIFGGPMIGTPEGAQTVVGLTIPMLTEDARRRAYRQVGVDEVDPLRGTLAVRTLSCARQADPAPAMPAPPQGQRAADIQVTTEQELPPPAASWSLSNGNQFTGDVLLTDARGVAGILNVEARSIRVKAVLPNGREYSATTLPILENVITLAELRPGLERWGQ